MGGNALIKAALQISKLIDKFCEGEIIYNPFHPIAVEVNRKKWTETH